MATRQWAYDFIYANDSDKWRVYTANDVGKVVRIVNTNTYWEITAVDGNGGATWRLLPSSSQVIASAASSIEENEAFAAGASIVIRTDLL